MSESGRSKIKTKVLKGRGASGTLKLICDHKCRKPLKFVQQLGWSHHFLPICDCKEHMYFMMPKHIDKSQFESYMLLATTSKNKIIFVDESEHTDEE